MGKMTGIMNGDSLRMFQRAGRFDSASLELAPGPEDPVQWTDTGTRIIEWAGLRWRVNPGRHPNSLTWKSQLCSSCEPPLHQGAYHPPVTEQEAPSLLPTSISSSTASIPT